MCYKKPAKPDVLQNKQLWSSGRITAAFWGTHSFGFWSSRTLVCKEKPHQNRVDWRLLWGMAHTFADWSQALKLGWLFLSNKINLPIPTKVWRELKNKRPILEWCGLSWNIWKECVFCCWWVESCRNMIGSCRGWWCWVLPYPGWFSV